MKTLQKNKKYKRPNTYLCKDCNAIFSTSECMCKVKCKQCGSSNFIIKSLMNNAV